MHKPQILAIAAILFLVAAMVVNISCERVALGAANPIQIDAFPKHVGGWRDVAELPPPAGLKDSLATAQMVERTYADSHGRSVDLLLLTATNYGDLHSPQACFPSQGWSISQKRGIAIGAEHVTTMSAALDGDQLKVLYWRPDFYKVPVPRTSLARQVYTWYLARVRPDAGQSLLVRVIGQDTPDGRAALFNFTAQILPPLSRLRCQEAAG